MDELKLIGWTYFECEYPTPKLNKDEMNKVIELIQRDIIENGYIFSGAEHQKSLTGVPVFSDGTCFRASMRCWGSIMADLFEGPNGEPLSYMDFYMSVECESNLPDYEDIDIKPAIVSEESAGCTLKADRQLIDEAIEYNMPLMTLDKVVKKLYEMKLQGKNDKN